jgi:hypothetical protein
VDIEGAAQIDGFIEQTQERFPGLHLHGGWSDRRPSQPGQVPVARRARR